MAPFLQRLPVLGRCQKKCNHVCTLTAAEEASRWQPLESDERAKEEEDDEEAALMGGGAGHVRDARLKARVTRRLARVPVARVCLRSQCLSLRAAQGLDHRRLACFAPGLLTPLALAVGAARRRRGQAATHRLLRAEPGKFRTGRSHHGLLVHGALGVPHAVFVPSARCLRRQQTARHCLLEHFLCVDVSHQDLHRLGFANVTRTVSG
mmetsp:Transcript_72821/g.168803  ORF Transcript_72821/g.168803 Transcript_72821/m.168803 type:complete len:208 (+) Transcript_72821:106-729(+)